MNVFARLSPEAMVSGAIVGFFILIIISVVAVKLIKRKRPGQFRDQWRSLQKRLPNKADWGQALIEADNLLDDALKKQKIKGKTTGERIVNAQKLFTENDAVWFGHKLRKKIETEPTTKLEKKDVVRALVGLRQGIKDLGAFDGKR
jgi:hypothetical protein